MNEQTRRSPRVTVGLTCYNAEKTIERAVASAKAQLWDNLEIVVIDDASTDSSWSILQRLASNNHLIKIVRHGKNNGAASARNSVLANATGEFLAFFDDDDESLPDRVRTQVAAILSYEAANPTQQIACFATGDRRYPNGYELAMPAIGSKPAVPKGEEVAEYLLYGARKPGVYYGSGTPTCALMARTSTFQSVGGFDPQLRRAEDIDFAIRLAISGGHFIGCPEKLFLQHATVASDKTPSKNLASELRLIDKHMHFLRERQRYSFARDWFKIRFYHFSGQRMRLALAGLWFVARFGLNGLHQIMSAAPRRIAHERKMSADMDASI